MRAQGGEHDIGPGEENARVPVVPACLNHLLRQSLLGLLDESLDGERQSALRRRLQIPIARGRMGGGNAKEHDLASSHMHLGSNHHLSKGLGIGDVMVRGREQ